MSSNRSGFACLSNSRMPRDSNWNTAVASACFSRSNTPESSSGICVMSSKAAPSARASLIAATVQSMIVSVFSPRKSNLTRPARSTSSLSNCDTAPVLASSTYSGTKSVSFDGAMTTPPACRPTLRTMPSSLYAMSMISPTSSLSAMKSRSSDVSATARSSVIPTSNGINFESRSARPYGFPWTRATSRTTAFAAMVPNVAIWLTDSWP